MMNKWTPAFIAVILFWSIVFMSGSGVTVYADAWIDGTPELHEQERFLYQVLGQDVGMGLVPVLDNVVPAAHKVGDTRDFYAANMKTGKQYSLEASARAVSDRAYIFVEEGRSIASSKIKSLLAAFDGIYDAVTQEFGAPPDSIDKDPRIYILILDILDKVQADGTRTLGYFTAINQYRNVSLARWTDRRSNEVEMIYIDYISLNAGQKMAESVVAHEFTHMVHWARDPNENVWVNEGIAVFVESMLNYKVDDRISAFEENADISLLDWSGAMADYGAAYLFFAYVSERFGGTSAVASIMKSRNRGTRGVERALAGVGKAVSFHDVFSDWVVANYLDNPKLDDGIYGYTNLDIHLKPSDVEDLYPIASKTSRVKAWGARYTEFNKEVDDVLSLTVYKNDGTDIVAQLIEFGDQTVVSSMKSGEAKSGTTIIPPEDRKVVLVVTSQPDQLVPGRINSDYNYSAEIEAAITPVEPAGRGLTTWGALKGK